LTPSFGVDDDCRRGRGQATGATQGGLTRSFAVSSTLSLTLTHCGVVSCICSILGPAGGGRRGGGRSSFRAKGTRLRLR